MCESVFKVLLIGDTRVGKTSMVARYCQNKWIPTLKCTVGADYAVKSVRWSNTETVRLHLWDIGGQDHYRMMTRVYYHGASGCVIMFDVTNRLTFQHVEVWKKDLEEKVVLPNGQPIPCILLANKEDLPDKAVSSSEIEKFAKDHGFLYWAYTSVKENRNVGDSMNQLIQHMLEQEYREGTVLQAENKDSAIKVGESGSEGANGGCCFR